MSNKGTSASGASILAPVINALMKGSGNEKSNALYDGFEALPEGMNAGMDTALVKDTSYARGINVDIRGGLPLTRPTITRFSTISSNPNAVYNGSGVYRLNSADRLIVVIGGQVYGLNLSTKAQVNYTEQVEPSFMGVPEDKAWLCQADRFMIVQDNLSIPLIIEEDKARLSNVSQSDQSMATGWEVPRGSIMAYGHGRLFLVPTEMGDEDGRRFFIAGDVMWPTKASNLLRFTETEYLSGGGAFFLPNEIGFITGMQFLKQPMTGNGTGVLIVFTRDGASAFGVNAPRATWQDIDISQVLFQSGGTKSNNSLLSINGDIFFRGLDGLRSIKYSASNLANTLANIPISFEINPILSADNGALDKISCALVDNRLFMTTQPNGDGTFAALAVMDFSIYSSLGSNAGTAFPGFWTGRKFLAVHSVLIDEQPRLLIIEKTDEGIVASLLEKDDSTIRESITSRLYTKSYECGYPYDQKRLSYALVSVSNVTQKTTLNLYCRPKGYPKWILATTAVIPYDNGYGRDNIIQLPLDSMEKVYDPLLLDDLATACEFEFCLEWTGNMRVDKFRFYATSYQHGRRLRYGETGEVSEFPGSDLTSTDFVTEEAS